MNYPINGAGNRMDESLFPSNNLREDTKLFQSTSRGRPRSFDINNALKIAMEIFWEKGYAQTTMSDICHAIGIKPASFYHAFANKESLFLKTLNYYAENYWNEITNIFMSEPDIYKAVKMLFESAIQVYMRPNQPKGCFIDISTIGLSKCNDKIHDSILEIETNAKNNIRKRLLIAIKSGQIPANCDVPAITNALYTFLKGISIVSLGNICESELNEIANLGVSLLPPRK